MRKKSCQSANIDKMDFSDAVKAVGITDNLATIKYEYSKVCKILDNYNFSVGSTND